MKCRVCDSKTDLYGTYERSALEVSRLYAQPHNAPGVELNLFSCPVCGHYQIPYVNSNDYYDEYLMTASHSPKIQQLQNAQANKLSSFASEKRSFFIEIGCGDGSFLTHVRPLFNAVYGVEPSKPYYELCKNKGLNVVNDYLTEKLTFDVKFDAFVSRQVFEHISQPMQILSIIYKLLDDHAVGLIEVPNGEKMLSNNRYYDLFSDHINYFTPLSLCYLAKKGAFDVISVEESFNGDYLELYVRKIRKTKSLIEKREVDFAHLRECATNYKNISAWGAGAKAQAIMTALGNDLNLKYLFDSDLYKTGRFIVNCGTQISLPNKESINKNDLIIIFAVSYQDEIINMLKNDFNFQGEIVCLDV